jgi:type II secretory pathway predicted ATPase ExeA/flagellar basal body-associated protein FliL
MYESFYGLTEKPFTLLPDPEYLYLSPKHQRALTLLQYGMMNQAGFSVICGDTGAGKTTLIRRLLSELEDNITVGLITNTHQSFGELLNWVLMAFGLDGEGKSKSQMHHIFVNFLIEQYAQNKTTVLIVDEAQNMKADTLEELRMLSNINADKDQVLQVILAGQPALRETLRRPELMQFAQRIAVDYYLEALDEQETHDYIQHRLQVAGAKQSIFTDDACSAIYQYSGGTPRLINLLCDTALVYGFAEQRKTIDASLVHDVVREQHSNSIIPTFNTSQPHATDKLPPVQPEAPVQKKPAAVESAPSHAAQNTPEAQVSAQARPQAREETQAEGVSTSASQDREQVTASAAASASKEKPAKAETDEPIADLARRAHQAVSEEHPAENTTQSAADDASTTQANSESQDSETDTGYHAADSIDHHHHRHDDVTPYMSQRSHREEHYPIVHIEDNPRKGLNLVLIGLVIGMFIASMMMMAFAWVMLSDRDERVGAATPTENAQPEISETERQQLEALKKERDAALLVSKALERERDAALTAARAQEQMRAAEVRAAEILAEQERKTEARLNEARARAREAEIAEAKARERERALQLRAQQRAAELEAQLEAERLEALRAEQARRELLKQQEQATLQEEQANKQQANQAPAAAEPVANNSPARTSETVSSATQKKQEEDKTSFSANPCNTPSAKFLSTCKR